MATFQVKINLILNVIFKKRQDARTKDKDSFDPTSNPSCPGKEFMPNAVALWCDPFWTGIYERVSRKTVISGSEGCSLFFVSQCMQFKGLTDLQEAVLRESSNEGPDPYLGICDSVKCHFYYEHPDNCCPTMMQKEIKKDFLYSSSFPLVFEGASAKKTGMTLEQAKVYGLFNFNCDAEHCLCIPDFRLVVHYVEPTQIPVEEVRLLQLKGPSCLSHKRVEQLANWINQTFDLLCPSNKSNFRNVRTYCRDFGNSIIFSHLPFLFEYPLGPSLPKELLFYCLYNALRINNTSARFVLESIFTDLNKKNINILFRIIRDSIIPWSMCAEEGIYCPDQSLSQEIEDQPFPLSFLPGLRIFCKDDCEGRISEAQQLKGLFVGLFRAMRRRREHVEKVARDMFSRGPENTRLNLSQNTWRSLVEVAFLIGKMLYEKIIEFHTTVGDVHFASFQSGTEKKEDEPLSGHSFGLLLFKDAKTQSTYASIVEGTGWERRILETDIAPTKRELEFLTHVASSPMAGRKECAACGSLSEENENNTYRNICLGNDCLFFTIQKNEKNPSKLDYGASLQQFKNNQLNKITEYDTLLDSNKNALQISFRSFCREMKGVYNHLCNRKSTSQPLFLRMGWIPSEPSPEKKKQWTSTLRNVDLMIDAFKEYEEDLTMIKRCVGTPQKSEQEFLKVFRSWRVLEEETSPRGQEGVCSGCFVTCTDPTTILNDKKRWESLKITAYPFMKSVILHVNAD